MFVCVHKIAGLCVCDDEAHESVNMSAIVSENVHKIGGCVHRCGEFVVAVKEVL